ncbi:MoaF C-terminal domain-containing protein [Methylopila sp. M107]|uniref:MoaF C-terminal domain-containing protein n=1 Tax=Methylopila sp. M107 TaxID=1101190 RepID=UPI00037FAB3F|nr:MoaF C-terminal domain-containing protein [Methylopila sp. M107]
MTSASTNAGDWPQIADILANHAGGRPDPSTELSGRKHTIFLAGGTELALDFETGDVLNWSLAGRPGVLGQPYQAFWMRDGGYFVDFIDRTDQLLSFSLWLDLAKGTALLIEGSVADRSLENENLLTRIERSGSQSVPKLSYRSGTIDVAGSHDYPRTSALLGKYLRYVYSDTHVYDHYYQNDKYYYWYCWKGPDAGIGEFDEAAYFDLGEELYLVAWTEKLLPCLAVTVEDHRAMTSIGKIFGADSHSWQTGNNTVGAKMTLVHAIPAGV